MTDLKKTEQRKGFETLRRKMWLTAWLQLERDGSNHKINNCWNSKQMSFLPKLVQPFHRVLQT
jgi:hypothetical protein